jgi:restriction system protein
VGCLVLVAGLLWTPAGLAGSQNAYLAAIGKQLMSGVLDPLIWVVASACWVAAAISAYRLKQRRRLLESRSDLDSLRAMSWRQLEQLVSEAYRRLGFQVEETPQSGADGGVDLILRRNGQLSLVQCKHWRTQRVGAPVVREQLGLLTHHQADAVIIVTTGDFTSEARAFAKGKAIELVTGHELLALVQSVQREPEIVLGPLPAVSETAPVCPKCASPMVTRTARKSGAVFFGCSQYPACRGTRAA